MEMDHTDAIGALSALFSNIMTPGLNTDLTLEGCRFLLDKITTQAESIVAKVHANQAGIPVACRSGCSYCCHAQVKATPMEVLVLFFWVQTTYTTHQKKLLKERIANNRHLTEDVDIKHRVTVKDLTPCIFLEKGRCSIYPVRPLICRAWTSYDQNICKEAFISGDHTAEIDSSGPSNFVYSLARQTIEKSM